MPFWKWIIFVIYIGLVSGLILFLYSCLKISSRESREEERRDAYTHTGRDFKK